MAFNIEVVPNQAGKPAILLRQAWREGKRVRKKTIANLSKLPPQVIEGFRTVLKGGVAVSDVSELLEIEHSFDHGNTIAVLGTARKRALARLLHRSPSRERTLALAAILARILAPQSKLATARWLSAETTSSSLGVLLGLGRVNGNELLDMLDWLLACQPRIEARLARQHLQDATLILYDVTSSFVEGRCCPLAAFGHNRDGKKGKKQIVFGLLCTSQGCPVAVELFQGNTADPTTVAAQVAKVRTRFAIDRIALVGDRGMITTARIREDLEPAGLDWISALKTSDVRKLAGGPKTDKGPPLSPEALVDDAVAEIRSPDFPGERLMVCLNPRLREERRRKREALLEATERILERIAAMVRGGTLAGKARIGRRVGREANRRKVEKHFEITIDDTSLVWQRRHRKIADEARFDGIYVIRTSLPDIKADTAVLAYKSLATVERAFRTARSDLSVRPIFVYSEDHVRAHVFLCMLAYYIEWHMRRRLAPLLFEDDDRLAAHAERTTPVEPARVSHAAREKARTKRTPDGFPVHSFRTLIDDLSGVVLNHVRLPGKDTAELAVVTKPSRLQARAFELLDIKAAQTVPITRTP